MEKKIYKKPEMDVLSLNIKDSVLESRSWTVDGNKEGNVKEYFDNGDCYVVNGNNSKMN